MELLLKTLVYGIAYLGIYVVGVIIMRLSTHLGLSPTESGFALLATVIIVTIERVVSNVALGTGYQVEMLDRIRGRLPPSESDPDPVPSYYPEV